MWLLRIYAFHKLTIALRIAHSAISCGQECYIMQPRMLYQVANSAISCGQECYIVRRAKNAAISYARPRMLYLSVCILTWS